MYSITISLKHTFYTVYSSRLNVAAQIVLDAIKLFDVEEWSIESKNERFTALRSPFGWSWVKDNDFDAIFGQ